ncbi:Helicase associated domain protein [Streptomyces sp. NPDC008238]
MATLTRTDTGLKTVLRGHQELAVDACVSHFLDGSDRVSVIMACGTGKTLVGLNAVHETAPRGRALVVMPTKKLLEQTAAAWRKEGRGGLYIGVCGLDTPEDPDLRGVLTTTGQAGTATEQARFLTDQIAQADGPVSVFSTYASLNKIAKAHRDFFLPDWDILIADEAHRTAGNAESPWAIIHDNDELPARHRLYMTATERVFDYQAVADGRIDMPLTEIASMDDLNLYGPVVYRLSLADAIEQGLLADYRIVAVVIHDEDLRRALNRHSCFLASTEGLRVAAAQVALLNAQHTYDLRRTLTFHTRVRSAEIFAETLHETAALMPRRLQGPLQVGTVNAEQNRFDRLQAFTQFASAPLHTPDSAAPPLRSVLTNCRCCTEGVDIPAIDSILFADPKTSSVEITQAVGRPLRQTPGAGKVSTIVIPVYLAPGQDMAEGTKRTAFRLLHQVLIALSVYDEHVFYRVDINHWKPPPPRILPPSVGPERADEIIPVLSLEAEESPNRVWELGFESAERFHTEFGHLDVPSRYIGPDRFWLGWWIGKQRSLRLNRMLLQERIDTLDTLQMRWEHPPHSIEHRLLIARDYAARHGHLHPLAKETFGGIRLGRWLAERRREARERTLPHPYHRALNEIDPWWNARWSHDWQRTYVQALAAARRGDLTLADLRPDHEDTALARWLEEQITAFDALHPDQQNLLGVLPLHHPLAVLLRRPRGAAEYAFIRGLRAARAYWRSYQHLNVPANYVAENRGSFFRLGEWIASKRRHPEHLTQAQLDALEALDMRWIPRQSSGPR